MKLILKKGTTSKRIAIWIADSSSSTGAGLTGLAYNTASLVAYYWREDTGNAGGTAITLATATRGSFTSGGFKEIDATNLPGWYEIGIPDAVVATGSGWAILHLKGAANMAPLPIEIQLVNYNPEDGNLGLTNLDAAVSTRLASASYSAPPSASTIRAEMDSNSSQLAAIVGYVDTEIAAIKTVADHLATAIELDSGNYRFTTAALANAPTGGGGGLDAAGVRTAIGLTSANLDTQLATLSGYIDTEVAAIKAKTDNLPSDPADASDVAGAFSTVNSTLATIAGYVDTEISAIKAVTDHLATAIELDGSVYRFTANALELAPGETVITPQIGISIADDGTATIIGHLEANGVNVELASGSMAVTVTEDSSGSPVSTFSATTSTVIDDHYFRISHAMSGLTAGEAYTFKVTITDASAVTYTRTFSYGVH